MDNRDNPPEALSEGASGKYRIQYFFWKSAGIEEDSPNSISKNAPKKLGLQVLRTILVDEYSATAGLIGKLFWPLCVVVIILIFHPEIRQISQEFSKSLSRTSLIRIGSLELIVDASFFRASDPEALEIIQELDHDEVNMLVYMFGVILDLRNDFPLTQEDENALRKLHERELVVFFQGR
jgi:hypothetical protein